MKLNEIFLSIQGEGLEQGLPTIFIRLTGCNLRCSYCDTKYAYEEGEEKSVNEILEEVKKHPYKRVCLTGGESLFQEGVKELITRLKEEGYSLVVETNGSIDISKFPSSISYSLDVKLPSSGMYKKMFFKNLEMLRKDDLVKFVIGSEEDYEVTKQVIKDHDLIVKTNVLLQPVFDKIEPKKIIEWVLRDRLDVKIGLQIHKYVWEPNKRGV